MWDEGVKGKREGKTKGATCMCCGAKRQKNWEKTNEACVEKKKGTVEKSDAATMGHWRGRKKKQPGPERNWFVSLKRESKGGGEKWGWGKKKKRRKGTSKPRKVKRYNSNPSVRPTRKRVNERQTRRGSDAVEHSYNQYSVVGKERSKPHEPKSPNKDGRGTKRR